MAKIEVVGDVEPAELDLVADRVSVPKMKGGVKMARASRIEEQVVGIATCPVCHGTIEGTVTVALNVGPLKVALEEKDGQLVPAAKTSVAASLRSMVVTHRCSADVAKPDAKGDPGR